MIEERTRRYDRVGRLCIILPRQRDGGMKVIMGLMEECVCWFGDGEFGRYVDSVW